MKIVEFHNQTELTAKNIKGFMKRKIVISGTSAKVNCPKEYLGCDAYLVILENGTEKKNVAARRRAKTNQRSSSKSS